jgi:hypothetical protein
VAAHPGLPLAVVPRQDPLLVVVEQPGLRLVEAVARRGLRLAEAEQLTRQRRLGLRLPRHPERSSTFCSSELGECFGTLPFLLWFAVRYV